MQKSSLSQYRKNQMLSLPPEKTVLMLYDGAIRFLETAVREVNENNNIVEKANCIERTVKILEYLQSCLDNEKGGEIALNLDKLYDYMSITLTKANLKNDTEKMEEVLNLLQTVREGWSGICNHNSPHPDNLQQAAKALTPAAGSDMAAEPESARSVGIRI